MQLTSTPVYQFTVFFQLPEVVAGSGAKVDLNHYLYQDGQPPPGIDARMQVSQEILQTPGKSSSGIMVRGSVRAFRVITEGAAVAPTVEAQPSGQSFSSSTESDCRPTQLSPATTKTTTTFSARDCLFAFMRRLVQQLAARNVNVLELGTEDPDALQTQFLDSMKSARKVPVPSAC